MTEPTANGNRGDPGAPSLPPVIVPDWLVNLASLGWRVIAVALLVVVLWLLATMLGTVTASIAVAVVVAALFAPMAVRLRAHGRSRTAAAAIVWATALLGITGVLILLGIAFLPYLGAVVTKIQAGLSALQAALSSLGLPDWAGSVLRPLFEALRKGTDQAGGGIASTAAEVVTIVVLATFLVFFFLRDGDKAWLWMFQALSDQKRERITAAGEDALERVGGYLRGTTILSAIIALTDLVFMLVLGVPLALPLAVLVFLSGYIPYFGGIVTTAIILLVTYATLGSGPVMVMLALIAVRNVFLAYGVRPAVYGRTVSIHPAVVLVALPAGLQLAGVIGLFAAVPMTAVILAVTSATVAIVTPDPRPKLPGLVPAWLDRVAQWSWRLLVGIGLVALLILVMVAIPLVVIPVICAMILVATLDPVVRWMVGRGRPRSQAAGIAVGGSFLAVTLMLLAAMAVLVGQVGDVSQAVTAGATSASSATGDQLGLLAQAVATLGLVGVQTVMAVAEGVASVAVIAVLSTMLSFYFLRDGSRLWEGVLVHAVPEVVVQVRMAGRRAFEVLGGYMFGTAAISLVGATSQFVIMVVLGIPLALPIFVLSFFLCFIPYVGGFISTGAALLVTIAYGDPTAVVVMVIWTLVFNIVTGNIVSPLVYGKTVHLHPAVVLVAIPAGGAIAGVLGMFIVVPAIGVVAATWRTVLEIMASRKASAGLPRAAGPLPDPRPGPAADDRV